MCNHTLFCMCVVEGRVQVGFSRTRKTLFNYWSSIHSIYFLVIMAWYCKCGISHLFCTISRSYAKALIWPFSNNQLWKLLILPWYSLPQKKWLILNRLHHGNFKGYIFVIKLQVKFLKEFLKCFLEKLQHQKETVSLCGIHPDNVQYVYLAAPAPVYELSISPLLVEMRTGLHMCMCLCV